jgi:hypothetical protein
MSHRTFVDANDITWQVWDVIPTFVERRRAQRRGAAGAVRSERRHGRERRVVAEPRVPARAGFEHGWLAFESNFENRRLAPIPDRWPDLAETELQQLCDRAMPSRRRPRLLE